jgi:hypothetical protein
MTTPSSTSQSLLTEPLGSTTVVVAAPECTLMALVKTTGSFGIGRPASAAWSA